MDLFVRDGHLIDKEKGEERVQLDYLRSVRNGMNLAIPEQRKPPVGWLISGSFHSSFSAYRTIKMIG